MKLPPCFFARRIAQPARRLRRRFYSAGFTMVEIAIALGVIGFALVAIIGILPSGLEVQRDNRTETIINHDGAFWLEAIRNGARGLEGLADYVDRIEISGPVRNELHSTFATGAAGSAQIIGLLTTQAVLPDHDVRAYVWAVSGSAAEKEPNRANRVVAFKYRLSVQIDNATNFAVPFSTYGPTNNPAAALPPDPLDSLYQVRVTLSYPLIPADETKPTSRRQSYRTLVNRHVRTNQIAGTSYYFLTE
jgi:type II secretory pathway pseudopilin PulG